MVHYDVTMDILAILLLIVMSKWVMEQNRSVHYVLPTKSSAQKRITT